MRPVHPRTGALSAKFAGAPALPGAAREAPTQAARGLRFLPQHSLTRVPPGPAPPRPRGPRPGPRSDGGLGSGPRPRGPAGRAKPSRGGGRRVTSAWRFRRRSPRPRLLLPPQRRRPPRSPGSPRRRRSPQTWRQRREGPESGAGRRQRAPAAGAGEGGGSCGLLRVASRPAPTSNRAAAASARAPATLPTRARRNAPRDGAAAAPPAGP